MMEIAKGEYGAIQSGKVIPAKHVTMFDPHARKPVPDHVPGSSQPAKNGPRVELIKDGDVVVAIEVYCDCGKVIRLECEY